jgi:hypothetical protein
MANIYPSLKKNNLKKISIPKMIKIGKVANDSIMKYVIHFLTITTLASILQFYLFDLLCKSENNTKYQ